MNIPKNISKNLTIIIDYNKYQSDLSVQDTSSLGNLKNKLFCETYLEYFVCTRAEVPARAKNIFTIVFF